MMKFLLSSVGLLVCLSLITTTLSAQNGPTVSGTVLDPTGQPLQAVSVNLKGSPSTVSTASDGSFSLPVNKFPAVLVFSSIGYVTQEHEVANASTPLKINLSQNSENLNSVLVVGYGVQKKRDLTGSVVSVSPEQINQVVALDAPQAIQGRVAGVTISQDNWRPGSGATVRIRGSRSITASNDPLYVVDGNPISGGISDFSPADIESIEVLKDASATAIYGSRGANGVVLITTNRGRTGKTIVRYDGYYGPQDPVREIDMMNGPEYAEYIRESFRNFPGGLQYDSPTPSREEDAVLPLFAQDPQVLESVLMAYDDAGNYDPSKVRWFDWMGATLQKGKIENHQVSVSGGSEKTRAMVSGGFFRNKGLIKNTDFQRISFRVNLDHDVTDWLKLTTSTVMAQTKENEGRNMYGQARVINPLALFYDDEGELVYNPGNDPFSINPLIDIAGVVNDNRTHRILTNLSLEAKIVEGLRFRTNLGYDYKTGRNGEFQASVSTVRNLGSPYARRTGSAARNILLENLLFYDKTFGSDHKIGITLLQSIQTDRLETDTAAVQGLPYESQLFYNLGSASEILGVGTRLVEWQMQSLMARINYSFRGKYLFTLTGRRDGASMLAEGNKYQFFPSAAFAWRVSDEPFVRNSNFINELKLRIGYGLTGNSSIIPYQTQGTLGLVRYAWDEVVHIGFAPNLMANPDLSWETSANLNIGLDFGLFNDRLYGSVDVYNTVTSDLIMPRQLPVVSGFSSVLTNVGKTRNYGLELAFTTVNIRRPDFDWKTTFMFTTNREKIVELVNGKVDDVGNLWFIGQPVSGVYYGEKFDGIWQNNAKDLEEIAKFNANGHAFEPGLIKMLDVNGDYRINTDDRVIIGTTRPKWIGSFTSDLNYKQFDFSFQFYTSYGATGNFNKGLQLNGRQNMVDVPYWTPTRPSNSYPKPNAGWLEPNYIHNIYYEDASYLRLKFVTLGYTLPEKFQNKIHANRLRVYLSAQNAFFLSSFQGMDPEGSQAFDSPSTRTIMFGVNASF